MTEKPLPTEFAHFLSDIFHSVKEVCELKYEPFAHSIIQPFTIEKLQFCFAKMRSNKCADTQTLNLEMIKNSRPVLWQIFIDLHQKNR